MDSSSPPFSNQNKAVAVFVSLPEIIAYIIIIILYVITRRGIKQEVYMFMYNSLCIRTFAFGRTLSIVLQPLL